jgi:hypothetical protein
MADETAPPITTVALIKELESTVTETGLCLSYWRVFNNRERVKQRKAVVQLMNR